MTGARQAEAEASLRLYHDGINHATGRLTRAAIAVKKLMAMRGAAMSPTEAAEWDRLQIAVGLRAAPALRDFPLMVNCICTAAGSPVWEDCEQCAGTGWVEAGWTATPTGEVVKL